MIKLKVTKNYRVRTFGNIVCFRDLEKATEDAIKTFSDENSMNIILEKSCKECMKGFADEETGETVRGHKDIRNEIVEKFPDPTKIFLEVDKKEFAQLFDELLKSENILENFDKFGSFDKIISDRLIQDMKSVYVDIRENIVNLRRSGDSEERQVDFSDVKFQIDLLKVDEINLDYILALILEESKEHEDVEDLKAEIRRVTGSSLGTRAKEGLVINFINKARLSELKDNDDILETFYSFVRKKEEKKAEPFIEDGKLKEGAYRFINRSTEEGFVDYVGTGLDKALPPTSYRQGIRERKKQIVLEKIGEIVEVLIGI